MFLLQCYHVVQLDIMINYVRLSKLGLSHQIQQFHKLFSEEKSPRTFNQ
jgi:hypothetical protein